MHTALHRFGTARSLLMTLALAAFPYQAADAAWKVTRFEVFAGAPYQQADGMVSAVGYDWAEAEDWFPEFDRAEVEQAFNAAAAWYSQKGFPEPFLDPPVDTENGRAYRVFVCSQAWWGSLDIAEFLAQASGVFGEAGNVNDTFWSNCGNTVGSEDIEWAGHNGRCAAEKGFRPVIFVNADGPAFKNGKLTVEGYQTIAHELFHAIEANSVAGKSPNPCEIKPWIGEGLADAVGMHVLEKVWPGKTQPTSDSWISKKWGIRPYFETIALDPSGYPVSSFWSFLAGLNGRNDYGYLLTGRDGSPGVLDFEITDAGKWQSEVMWLDQGLYSKFNMRLNELLGLFMNDYAMHIPPLSWTAGNAETDWPKWVKGVLGECEEITLSERKPSQIFTRDIEPVAGDCAWLTVNVAQATAQVSLQSESADVAVFKDTWVGLAEGNAVLTDAMMAGTSPKDPSKSIGIWANITVTSGFPTLLTFTNAADDPEDSKKRKVTFDISINSSTNNLRGNAPAGPGKAAPPALKPSYKKKTQTLQQKTSATTAMITEQKRLDKEALSPHAAQSLSVSLRPELQPCQEPFKYTPCGPYTSISVNLAPGTYLNLGQTSGTGGTASQIFSSMMGQALSNPFDATEVMVEMGEKLEAIDAASVSIMMPFIDYGFTGSVDNAMISTKVGGIQMDSIGPLDANHQTPLIGSVSIEEYTPFRIQGTYTAPLAYFEPAPGPNDPPIYRRGPTLSGTFSHVAPWLEDSRVTHIQLQSESEMADDIAKSLGIPAATMRSLREQGAIPGGDGPAGGGSSSPGGGSSGGVVDQGCDCDCASKGKVDELCEFFCEEQFAACP